MSDAAAKPDADRWTIGRLLNWTTDYFTQRKLDSPRLEAEVLLAHARGCQRIMLYTAFEEEATDELRTKFRELVKQRVAGVPFAYLAGKKEFFSLEFEVSSAVLIPRPETELLVTAALDRARRHGPVPLSIADVGTGSGIVAVCLARQLKMTHVTAIDISPAALEIARRNAAKHKVSERIEFVESDLLAAVDGATFDLIVSNPPYIPTAEIATLDADVRDHEPRGALDGGPSGTEIIERLVEQAAERLGTGGYLAMEVSPMIAPRVREIVSASSLRLLDTLKDLAGHERIIQAERAK